LDRAIRAIESEFRAALGKPERVAEACQRLAVELAACPATSASPAFERLLGLLEERQGPVARTIHQFLRAHLTGAGDPESFVLGFLNARDLEVRADGVELALASGESEGLPQATAQLALGLARALAAGDEDRDEPRAKDSALLARVRRFLERLSPRLPHTDAPGPDPVEALWWGESPEPLRRLAARVLDAEGDAVPEARARVLLGKDAFDSLAPYLSFTRASHRDLLDVSPSKARAFPGLSSLLRAEAALGRELLGEVIGTLGWSRILWGLEVHTFELVSVDGGFPFLAPPPEAEILAACGNAQSKGTRFLVIAHGGPIGTEGDGADVAPGLTSDVQRFRRYNLAHAEVLADLLEIAPLTGAKARRILERTRAIVEDFVALFARVAEDAERVPAVFEALREEILARLEDGADEKILPPEATRLVQMFEDPTRVEDVRTIHGLKRYLHQKGLRHAFTVFRSGPATNRSVDVVVASRQKILEVVQRIRYIEFEPQPGQGPLTIPFTVALLARGFGRQLLWGEKRFPYVEILGYGTEIHLYVRFRNHPVFVRIDLSPPLKGGMIDLEYFGVSQYELDQHPDVTLAGIRRAFRRLEFDVSLEGVRLRIRYDKERARDLEDLVRKLEILFHFLPYLMDFDWVLGGLDYAESSRERIADAWADFLEGWGVLPTDALLTQDRRRVLLGWTPDPAGDREIPWDGRAAYRDRYSGYPREDFWTRLRGVLHERRLAHVPRWRAAAHGGAAQLRLERLLIQPLREAAADGVVRATSDGWVLPDDPTAREHEADRFAAILAAGGEPLRESARLAELVAGVERHLRFLTTGSVNGHPVQRCVLPLRGERLTLFLLRDPDGMGRLSLATLGETPFGEGAGLSGTHAGDRVLAVGDVVRRLRWNNYLGADPEPPARDAGAQERELLETFRTAASSPAPRPLPGDCILPGLSAAPGRAAGFVRFPAGRGKPERSEILVAPVVRPEDGPLLRAVSGVVSTGGGVLSHAGLVALELGTPALVVAGHWQMDADGAGRLLCRYPVFREEEAVVAGMHVVRYADLQEKEVTLRAGELVVVDADGESLVVLGDHRDALALHQEIRHLGEAAAELAEAAEAESILAGRGRVLRASHQLARLLGRMDDPALARYAVRELLDPGSERHAPERGTRRNLLSTLFANPAAGAVAREAAARLVRDLEERRSALAARAAPLLATSADAFELLFLRKDVLRVGLSLAEARAVLGHDGGGGDRAGEQLGLDELARTGLEALRHRLWREADEGSTLGLPFWRLFHLLEGIRRIAGVLKSPLPAEDQGRLDALAGEIAVRRERARDDLSGRVLVWPGDGGLEVADLVGRKAANLGEVARVTGVDRVPAWFAVTDRAFRSVLACPVEGGALKSLGGLRPGAPLQEGIASVLAMGEMEPERQSAAIREMWRRVRLPEDLLGEVLGAYARLGEGDPLVAVRSSAFEEDTEGEARAGAFDTFLFVRGREALAHTLRMAWAGLWTERAIHHRRTHALQGTAGGGVIVQRMVEARASGVVHTVAIATRQLRDLVVNVGLGMGEGVVSGTVEVDHVLVAKDCELDAGPLRFRYRVGDKKEHVAFDARAGQGTRRVETLYHQRFRPALEYSDLRELVETSLRLERHYGCPLDIEFAFDGPRLAVLQVRPIPLFQTLLREATERFPLLRRPRGPMEP
jgi:phosphohistidine swiveling domain-containing protein